MSDERLISIDRIWARVRGRLRQEFGESTYRSWIRSLVLEEVIGERVTLAAPTLFMRDRIVSQYGDRITLAWAAESADTVSDCLITVITNIVVKEIIKKFTCWRNFWYSKRSCRVWSKSIRQ